MSVYRGVVRDGRVELPPDAGLADGTVVEIHTVPSDDHDDARALDGLERRLLESGLVREFKRPPFPPLEGDRTLIHVKGKPLSEQIIEDRR